MKPRTLSYTRNLLTTSWMIHPGVAASLYPMLAGALSGAVFEVQPLDRAYTVPAAGDGGAPQSSYKVFVDKISGTMFKHDSCCDKGTRTIASELLEADADPEVAAHVLIIESGGGASNSVPEARGRLRQADQARGGVGGRHGLLRCPVGGGPVRMDGRLPR